MKVLLRLWLTVVSLATLVGCSKGVMIGETPSEPAPQIMFLGAKDSNGDDYLTWKDVPSFGQVPSSLQAMGDISCMQYGLELRAVGYHPEALDRKGNKIPGGGFFCSAVAGLLAQNETPQLVESTGGLTWKNPGAFVSKVTEQQLSEGQRICSDVSPTSVPLAYSANALNPDGSPIENGAFLCVEPIEKY